MEHLFMQIFERRDWIASQLRQQEESYAQSVASNLLAAGGLLPLGFGMLLQIRMGGRTTTLKLEESSIDVHVGNQSDQDFQGAIPLEEMKDTIGSVACKKEFATDEDAIDLPDELYLPSKMNEDKNQDDIRGSYTTLKVDKKKDVSLSVNGNKEQEDVEALHDVPNKIPLKASEQKRSQAILEKKTINIVSNVQSFIPLVRQKQQAAAAPITGRRDIKVKALEVAEAAKRLAEKRECERKMRKEAVRLERIKSEQENARQLELKQKQKEEDWKKKEAAMAARKRQREEERKEKQRKRNCKEHEFFPTEPGSSCFDFRCIVGN
ncbi:unnamed protein product [Spirodela intermedia]|uniref:Uncharacterized protein n=1 Tax=Spirodela intermedia TaxID=51605 RepID=A0A7I8JM90_SPIIN|nr:unnamed protein product [Spirodela intermedia]CAA6670693.1 unnamed protein product [Spirodela intermedia]